MAVEHDVTAENLESLSDMFRMALRGSTGDAFDRYGNPASLGPLMHVVAWEDRWRPDWMALARWLLDGALKAFGAAPPRFNSPHTAESAVAELRRDLGIDVYPSKHGADKVARNTRLSWEAKLYGSDTALASVSRRLKRLAGSCEGSCTKQPTTFWTGWTLAAPEFWVGSVYDEWLIGRAGTVLSRHRSENDDRPDLLRSLIRGAVAGRLAEYFDGTEHDAVNYYRYLHHAVLPAWATHITHGPLPDIAGGDEPEGGNYKMVLAAATQMFACLVTSALDDRESLRCEYEQLYVSGTTGSLWQLLDGHPPLRVGGLVVGLVDFQGLSRLERSGSLRPMLPTASATTLAAEGIKPVTGEDFMRLAWDIRGCTDPNSKERYLTAYVSARERTSPKRADAQLLNSADHLVSWDTVTAELPILAARLAHAVEHNQTPGVSGYRIHLYRSAAILANKRNKSSLADHLLNLGIAQLASFAVDLPEVERLESYQQMLLAKAGVYARQTEMYLREAPRRARVAQAGVAAHRALAAAGAAHRLLLQLAAGLPLDPVAARGQGRIGSASWNIQTRMIRLRCALAARTVIAAGLAGEDLLEGLDDSERRIVADAGELALGWRELIGRDELAQVHLLDLCRVGLWLGFLTGMEVPVTLAVSRAASRMPFFDVSPADIEAGKQERIVDPEIASRWLTNHHRADAGWLSWARRRSAAADSLDRLSGGAYRQWRNEEELRCKNEAIARSHD